MAEAIFFWIFAGAAVLSAVAVVIPPLPRARNPIHSAIALVACFFCVAAIYVLLAAHLIAVLQILVYAGAIMVLFVFVIMLLNQQQQRLAVARLTFIKVIAVLLAISTGYGLVTIFTADTVVAGLTAGVTAPAEGFGQLESVGTLLFNRYLLPFELTSILLLVAIVGAVIIAKRDPHTTFISEQEKVLTAQQRHGKRVEEVTNP